MAAKDKRGCHIWGISQHGPKNPELVFTSVPKDMKELRPLNLNKVLGDTTALKLVLN